MFSFPTKQVPEIMTRFFGGFRECFTPGTQERMQEYFVSLFLPHKRFSIQAVAGSKEPDAQYQRLQYAFSDTDWNPAQLDDMRLNYIMRSPATAPTTGGILAIDDTSACKARSTKHTEGAKVQYCGSEGRLANCNVFVYSGYADSNKHFLIDSEPYIPKEQCDKLESPVKFRSKIELCKDLIDKAIAKGIPFSYICFDNWYLCRTLVEYIQRRKRHFISELAVDDRVSIGGRWMRADGLVKAIPPTKAVTVSDASNKSRSFLISARITKVRGLPGKYQIILAQEIEPSTKKQIGKLFILITEHLCANAEFILHSYLLRWGIERCFEECKDFCYLDHYQVRRISRIRRHLSLAVLAHTFLYSARKLGSFSKSIGNILGIPAKAVKRELRTFGDLLRAIRALIVQKNQKALANDATLPAAIFLGL